MARRHRRKSDAQNSSRMDRSYYHATYEENQRQGVLLNGCASGCDLNTTCELDPQTLTKYNGMTIPNLLPTRS